MTILVKHLILLIAMLFTFFMGLSQVSEQSDLYKALKEKDSLLFDAAFNRCDTDTMEALFTEDFEFYHDKGGATIGRESFLAPTIENCANRNPADPQPSKRILQENSLEVYPLYNKGELYGAIQHGIHRFEFLNEEKIYQRGDTARFTHIWILEGEDWKIKRELSYDHQAHQVRNTK
ncbi:MAG: nuclear transport factor 2 family protein [Flavobacteriaceae bacterium]